MLNSSSQICILDGSKRCEISGFLLNNVRKFFEINKYKIIQEINDADVIVINTCGVTNSKIEESEKLINMALNVKKKIIILGCLVNLTVKYKQFKHIIHIGPKDLSLLNKYFAHQIPIEKININKIKKNNLTPYQHKLNLNNYYILISQGCEFNCSYCNIKIAKGNVLSFKKEKILNEIKEGLKKGYNEFTLLADDCGSYGLDINSNIIDLIKEILEFDKSIIIKISSLHPTMLLKFSNDFKLIFQTQRISYINISLQSTSKRILKLMNRNYNPKKVINLVKKLKKISPKTWFYTHILINFPTETRNELLQSLIDSFIFDERMIITYSDNPLTQAKQINPKIDFREQNIRLKMCEKIMKQNHKGLIVGNMKAIVFE